MQIGGTDGYSPQTFDKQRQLELIRDGPRVSVNLTQDMQYLSVIFCSCKVTYENLLLRTFHFLSDKVKMFPDIKSRSVVVKQSIS